MRIGIAIAAYSQKLGQMNAAAVNAYQALRRRE
jgi:hypothetical protein